MKGIGSWLVKHSEINGDKLAIVFKERRLTYFDLNARVNRLANGLSKLGVRKRDRVAALLMNGNEILEGIFACAKLGAIFVPINTRLATGEIEYILSDTGARVIIYHNQLLRVAEEAMGRMQLSCGIKVGVQPEDNELGYELLLDENSDNEPGFDVDGEDICLLIYTSGTTGKPKGAIITHANIQWNAFNILNSIPLRYSDIALTVAPLFHVAALGTHCMPLIYKGGTNIIDDQFEPVRVLEMIAREKITCLFMVPTMWFELKNASEFDKYDIGSLRCACTGSAATPITILEFYKKIGVPMYEGYGASESGPVVSYLVEKDSFRKNGSVGKPVMHVDVRIVDNDGKDVPRGEVGELLVQGPAVAKEYWNNPEATQETIKGGWLHTGDMFRMDEEGFLYIVDRKKDMIITGGENVYSAEVEQVLYKHPDIKEVAIIGVPDEKWGESVTAVIVLKDVSKSVTIEALQEFCGGKLARYKMPKSLKIVPELPRTATGKVFKVALRNLQ